MSPAAEVLPGLTNVTFNHTVRNVGTARGTDEVTVTVAPTSAHTMGGVDRDGTVSIVDAVRIQRYLADIDENGTADLSELDAPGTVARGEPLDVAATLTNGGDMGTVQTLTVRLDNATLAPNG